MCAWLTESDGVDYLGDSIVYIISAPASPLLGFLVDRTGKNVVWVLCAVASTLAAHMMLAFTFWNPWIAMVTASVVTAVRNASDLSLFRSAPGALGGGEGAAFVAGRFY